MGPGAKGLDCPLRGEACPMSPPARLSSVTWRAPGGHGKRSLFQQKPLSASRGHFTTPLSVSGAQVIEAFTFQTLGEARLAYLGRIRGGSSPGPPSRLSAPSRTDPVSQEIGQVAPSPEARLEGRWTRPPNSYKTTPSMSPGSLGSQKPRGTALYADYVLLSTSSGHVHGYKLSSPHPSLLPVPSWPERQ